MPFYIILNLALGGSFPCGGGKGASVKPYSVSNCNNGIFSPPDLSTQYNMYVNYVRVYGLQQNNITELATRTLLWADNFQTLGPVNQVRWPSPADCMTQP